MIAAPPLRGSEPGPNGASVEKASFLASRQTDSMVQFTLQSPLWDRSYTLVTGNPEVRGAKIFEKQWPTTAQI